MLLDGKIFQKFGLRVKGSSFPNEIVCLYPQTWAECMLGGKITICFLYYCLWKYFIFWLLWKITFFFSYILSSFHLASCLNCGSSVSPLNIGNSQGSILITLSHLLGFIFHLSFSYQLYIDDLEFYISLLLYLLPHKLLNWDAPLNIYKLMISDRKNPIVYKQYSSTQPLLLILQACLLIFCIVHQTAALLT